MKLVTFVAPGRNTPHFGVLLDAGSVVAFETIQLLAARDPVRLAEAASAGSHARGVTQEPCPELSSVEAYLSSLPRSQEHARELWAWARAHREQFTADELFELNAVRLLPALARPPAMFDFGLTPRHLKNSATTLLCKEFGWLVGNIAALFVRLRIERMRSSPVFAYYKCNHCEVIGDGETTGWPAYASYLDIEPELALVVGNEAVPIAGYVIFNDMSARDVQFPEMVGMGPARSKDFARSNGIGSLLVTPDELPDPRALAVRARITDRRGELRFDWHGSTAEYMQPPERALEFLRSVFTPPPGTVIALGTIPDCTGLDHDAWLWPGDQIEITFDVLGSLRQRIPEQLPELEPSRWRARPELAGFSGRRALQRDAS